MIIGYINMVSKALRHSNLKTALLQKCRDFSKQITFMMPLIAHGYLINCKKERIRMPSVNEKGCSKKQIRKITSGIVTCAGYIRDESEAGKVHTTTESAPIYAKAGYQVASLGTEPEAELFGFEGVYQWVITPP